MFDHVTIRVSDREASQRFYDTALAVLGIEMTSRTNGTTGPHGCPRGQPVTRRLHVDPASAEGRRVLAHRRRSCRSDGDRPRRLGDDHTAAFLDPMATAPRQSTTRKSRTTGCHHPDKGATRPVKRFRELVALFGRGLR
jgi:catechol 2,3-dioxygenase-like lactoylglutathione lyase family enzyme